MDKKKDDETQEKDIHETQHGGTVSSKATYDRNKMKKNVRKGIETLPLDDV